MQLYLFLEFHDFRTLEDSYMRTLPAQVAIDQNLKHFDEHKKDLHMMQYKTAMTFYLMN